MAKTEHQSRETEQILAFSKFAKKYFSRMTIIKIIFVFFNQYQICGNFCKNSHFFKIIVKNGESVTHKGKHLPKISSDTTLMPQSIVFILLLVLEQSSISHSQKVTTFFCSYYRFPYSSETFDFLF